MLSGHTHATLARIRAPAVVWLVQDTTFLHDGTTPPTQGMGTVQSKGRDASRLHPTVAFTPERRHRGVFGRPLWQRLEPPVAQERHRQPLAAQESDRWLPGYPWACAVQQRCPDTRVVSRAERAGESQAWCLEAVRRAPEDRAACLIRAQGNRRLGPGQTPSSFGEARPKARAAGAITVELTRQPPRAPRQATRRVAVKRVTCTGARRPGGPLPPVEVVAVYATERRPPRNQEPLEGLLLTRLPVADFPRACLVLPWSQCRWEIARFFRGLKPGGQLEP
jgi:hypothetical protein